MDFTIVEPLLELFSSTVSEFIQGNPDADFLLSLLLIIFCAFDYLQLPSPRKKRRRMEKVFIDPVLNMTRPLEVRMSTWWLEYMVNHRPDDPRWATQFRRRFRLPYESFLELVDTIKTDDSGIFD